MIREDREQGADPPRDREVDGAGRMSAKERRLDLGALGIIALVIALAWLPTLASGHRVNPNDDFFLHASRHEAVRKSLLEQHVFPLRSYWFGGGFPTLGEPEDPALNPLVLLSLLCGTVVGLKLIALVATLVSGLGTYALARFILDHTRWGALFSALIVGTSLFGPAHMMDGNYPELCAAYLPLCMFLIALSCRGRRAALFLLPFVFYTMVCSGKQGFFMAMFYLAVLFLMDALPMFHTFTAAEPGRKFDARAFAVLVLTLGVAFFVGMVRLLPALEFMAGQGGLTHPELQLHAGQDEPYGPSWRELWHTVCSIDGRLGTVTTGWLPIILLGAASCSFWKRSFPWVVTLVLCSWLVLADKAPVDIFRLLQGLPVFGTITSPYKYFSFPIVLCIALGSGQFFWLLRRLPRRWLEHVCSVVLIVAAVGFLCVKTTAVQLRTYAAAIPASALVPEGKFFNVQGLRLARNRATPLAAVAYTNLLRNVGTVDWHTAMPLAENAVPKYYVNAEGDHIVNPEYRGEAFLVGESGALEGVAEVTFRPNSIAVRVTVPKPGVLIINQNYHPAWRTDRGELFDRDGLIALRLQETGSYTIRLRYLPRSFVVGLIVSVLSIAGWALACWASATGRLGRWSGLPGQGGQAIRR
ncbi:MAG: hypothetical protein ACE5JM_05665 [Armatimonadota bacterium]